MFGGKLVLVGFHVSLSYHIMVFVVIPLSIIFVTLESVLAFGSFFWGGECLAQFVVLSFCTLLVLFHFFAMTHGLQLNKKGSSPYYLLCLSFSCFLSCGSLVESLSLVLSTSINAFSQPHDCMIIKIYYPLVLIC